MVGQGKFKKETKNTNNLMLKTQFGQLKIKIKTNITIYAFFLVYVKRLFSIEAWIWMLKKTKLEKNDIIWNQDGGKQILKITYKITIEEYLEFQKKTENSIIINTIFLPK